LEPYQDAEQKERWQCPACGWKQIDVRPTQTLLLEREAEGRPKMVRTREWKYIYDPLDPDGAEELYDLAADPWELTNLAGSKDPVHERAKVELLRQLLSWSICTEDGTPVPLAFGER
jgi:hypothetical protein